MKIIKYEEIKNTGLDERTMYKWAIDVLKLKKDTILPSKISMKENGHIFYNIMPSVIFNQNVSGVKIVSRIPERVPSLDADIIIYNNSSGELLALMDGTYITTIRTGAIAALAIETLAIKNYYEMAIVGLGNTARATLLMLLPQLNGRKIKIKLLAYKKQEESFIERFKEYSNIEFVVVDNYEKLIRNSDVILSCVTYFEDNISKDEWYKEGCLLVPVHTMGFQNCDLFFDKVIVDDISHVQNFKYFNQFKECYELADIITNRKKGRENNCERIIAYNIGISIQDIYFAKKIYDMNTKKQNIKWEKPKDKFWI